MWIKTAHRVSGIIIAGFIGLHLFNHLWSIFGAEKHIAMMDMLRQYYRNIFVETVLLICIGLQLFSGIRLFSAKRKHIKTRVEKIQLWTGFYLFSFLIIHLSAVMSARLFLQVDTNFYFGVAGINTFPFNLFFIPYYSLAILSFFAHMAAIHSQKMRRNVLGASPRMQGIILFTIGLVLTLILFYGFTNGFKGTDIPDVYKMPGYQLS